MEKKETNKELIERHEARAKYNDALDTIWVGGCVLLGSLVALVAVVWPPFLWCILYTLAGAAGIFVLVMLGVFAWMWVEAIKYCLQYKRELKPKNES
jgi:hypothetical protein